MVSCKHCQTLNSLDSVFCKRCGTTLDEAEIAAARANNETLIAEGTRLFNDGQTDEAMSVAEMAVLSDPRSVSAHALRGMVHERRGELAEALECYERIVEINPDSALDRIKLNSLRNALVASARPASSSDRKWAAFAAAATVVLLGSLGALWLRAASTAHVATVAQAEQNSAAGSDLRGFDVQNPAAQPPLPQPSPNTAAGLPQAPPSAPADPRPPAPVREPALPPVLGGTLPNPEGNVAPVIISPERPLTGSFGVSGNRLPDASQPPAGAQVRPSGDPPPVPDPAPPPAEEPDPGVIEITVRNQRLPGGGETIPDVNANGVRALLETARNQFETGNFAGAVASYERAIRAGADPGTTNQRLGMAYERLGRKGDAANAYQRAVDALEAQVRSGAGDRAQRALDASRAALRALRGG